MGAIKVAELLTIKDLQEGHLDTVSLGEYANEDKIVISRLGSEYPSAPMQARINTEKGLLPATVFGTKEKMTTLGSSLPDGSYALVAQDAAADNNGNYEKVAGAWVYLKWNPTAQSAIYVDSALRADNKIKVAPSQIQGAKVSVGGRSQDTVFDLSDIVFKDGYYVNESGVIVPTTNAKVSDLIQHKQNTEYVIEKPIFYPIAAYDKDKNWLYTIATPETSNLAVNFTNPDVAFFRVILSLTDAGRFYVRGSEPHSIDWLMAKSWNIADAVSQLLSPPPASTPNLLTGVTTTAGAYIAVDGSINPSAAYEYSDYIAVTGGEKYVVSRSGGIAGAYYDSDKRFKAAISGIESDNFEFVLPISASFVRINIAASDTVKSLKMVGLRVNVSPSILNGWRGKTIAWYGTSIPAAYPKHTTTALQDVWSHANLAVHDLGATIINKAVPSSGVNTYTEQSFVNVASAINYQNSLIALIGTAQQPDLVVFDFGVNDYQVSPADIDNFDPLDPYDTAATGTKTKIDTKNTNTFIGAYNTIIDAMLTAKPDIKFCFITHFSDDNGTTSVVAKDNHYAKVNIVIEALADYWSAPVFRLHKKTNLRHKRGFNSITPTMTDGIHPASGDGKCVQSLRHIMRDFLVSIA